MGTADVVGFNLQTGHAVGLGVIAQDDVAHFLVGIGLVRAGFDANDTAENRPSLAGQRILVKQVAGCVGFDMILERALVDHLFVRRDIDRKHVAARTLGDHAAVVLIADEFPAEVDLHAEA